MEARLAAYNAELVAELAARRPDALDRQIGEVGAASPDWLPGAGREAATGVSEFFADELALILGCSRTAATKLADAATLLAERLPATWAALADGLLDWPRARALVTELMEPAREVEPQLIAEVEAAVLPRAAEMSLGQLQAAARRELLHRDAAAADRRRAQAERATDVALRPARDGMAKLFAFMPHPLAAAISRTVDDHARMARAEGDTRPVGQLRAGVLADLVLRPWDTTRPPVTAHLTVIAPLETITTGVAGHDACAVGHLGGCGCAGQRRFVRTRDRTCRHPGCRIVAAWADLDHVIPHGLGGETACENLCYLCRRHHRLKTHAAGWRFVMTSDGVLAVTTHSGVTRIARPSGLAPPDDPAPF